MESYSPNQWRDTDFVTAKRMNNLESGADTGSHSGMELAAATRLSQFSWDNDQPNVVEGLEVYVDTSDGPAKLIAETGVWVVNGAADSNLYVRLVDLTTGEVLRVVAAAVKSDGTIAVFTFPPVSTRIQAGRTDRRYGVSVQNTSGQNTYIVPEWLADSYANIEAIGL